MEAIWNETYIIDNLTDYFEKIFNLLPWSSIIWDKKIGNCSKLDNENCPNYTLTYLIRLCNLVLHNSFQNLQMVSSSVNQFYIENINFMNINRVYNVIYSFANCVKKPLYANDNYQII